MRLKSLSADTDTIAAESISTAALKQTAPDALESIKIPINNPTAADTPVPLNIEKAVKSGIIISGSAFFMLISIISV